MKIVLTKVSGKYWASLNHPTARYINKGKTGFEAIGRLLVDMGNCGFCDDSSEIEIIDKTQTLAEKLVEKLRVNYERLVPYDIPTMQAIVQTVIDDHEKGSVQ